MDVFVGNLADSIGVGEIESLFRPYCRQARFRIIRTVGGNGSVHRFARGVIHPERAALRALARLNGSRLQGRQLVVRAFVHRAYGNERRALDWRKRPWPWAERRQGERRHHREERRQPQEARFSDEVAPPIASPWYDRWFDVALDDRDNVRIEAYANFAVKHAL